MKKTLFALGASLIMATGVQAINVGWTGGGTTGDWNDVDNWDKTALPGSTVTDHVIFDIDDNSTLTTKFRFANTSKMVARRGAAVTIGHGGSIKNLSSWFTGANRDIDGGHIILSGGSINGENMTTASSPWASSRSSLTVSGGALILSDALIIGALGDFYLNGSTTTFDVGNFTVENGSTNNIAFDSAGISSIDASGSFIIGEMAALNIDLSSYEGTGDFDLVTFTHLYGAFSSNSVNFAGLDGRTATLEVDSDSVYVHLDPRPAKFGLLGLGALLMMVLFKQPQG